MTSKPSSLPPPKNGKATDPIGIAWVCVQKNSLYKHAKEPEAKEAENSSEQVATTTAGQNTLFYTEKLV